MQMIVLETDAKTMQHVWIKLAPMSANVLVDTLENSAKPKSHFVPLRNSVHAKMVANVLTISHITLVNAKMDSVGKTVHEI